MDLVKQISVKTAQCDELRHENAGLRERLAKAEASMSRNTLNRTAPAVDKQRPPTGHWLIDDSLLRDVDAVGTCLKTCSNAFAGGILMALINFSKNRKRKPAKSSSSSEPMTASIRMQQT